VLTQNANEFLCAVGAEKPAGKLLRRYWHPVGIAPELSDKKPKKRVRVLGEDLVLFRLSIKRLSLLAKTFCFLHIQNDPPSVNYRKYSSECLFELCEWGIRKSRVFEDGEREIGHLLVFPNMLRHPGSLHFRVAIDDTHTQIYRVIRLKEGPTEAGNELRSGYITYKNSEDGEFHMENFPSQDAMAWETQGPLTDRTKELLGESDRGITLFRKMLREQIELVMSGGEPIALIRDPANNQVINFLTSEWQGNDNGRPGAGEKFPHPEPL